MICDPLWYVKTGEIYGGMAVENDNKHMNKRKFYKLVKRVKHVTSCYTVISGKFQSRADKCCWLTFWAAINCNNIEVKEHIDQGIQKNLQIHTTEITSETRISSSKKPCQHSIRLNQIQPMLIKSGNIWTIGLHALKIKMIAWESEICLLWLFCQTLICVCVCVCI